MASVLEVSEERLLGNVRSIRQVLDGVELLGVVKANAYGHSAEGCAPMLMRGGVRWLGVTDAQEGAVVRKSLGGAEAEILVMSAPPGDKTGAREAARLVVRCGLTPVVWTIEQVRTLAEACEGEVWPVHLEVETGMSRQGIALGELEALLVGLAAEARVRLDGVLTHLASAERAEGVQTLRQMEVFEEAVGKVVAAGFRPRWIHVGNASTVDNGSVAVVERLGRLAELAGARAMVRCGLGLYGLCLPTEGAGESRLRGLLRPVLEWRTTVTAVREVEVGTTVGYGATYVAERTMWLALLSVGYADGLRRGLSGTNAERGGWVMIRGQRAPIVGRVSMNLSVVDVTGFDPAVRVGETVTLLGAGVTAEDHARVCGTIPYEILCGVRGRHVRV